MVNGGKERHGTPRRTILKVGGALGATGALGSLAGCTGNGSDGGGGSDGSDGSSGDGGSDGNGGSGGNGTDSGDGGSDGGDGSDGGGSETITIQFLSAGSAENSAAGEAFSESMKAYEQEKGNVKINLQSASYGDIKSKIASTVGSGNAPDLAEAGSAGLTFFLDGEVPAHGQWIEATEGYPDNWTATNQEVAKFRGEWWGGGAASGSARGIALRPKLVSQVGVSDPLTEMKTWSQMYDVISRIDEQLDTIAWEETGEPVDLESYWGEARTAYTNGDDPWIRGDPTDPQVLMGEEPATDGMVKNCVKLAHEFSSSESAGRSDEEMASLMLTDKVAIYPHGFQAWTPFTTVKQNAKIGWHDGTGDVMWIPYPKMDGGYGPQVGLNELEGITGQHGGHVSALEASKVVFKKDQKKMDAAWDLNVYTQTSEKHMIPVFGNADPGIPQWTPMFETFRSELDLPQLYTGALKALEQYGSQYTATGASWDVKGTDQIRWTDINETVSQSIAGQISPEKLPTTIREKILSTLEDQNT